VLIDHMTRLDKTSRNALYVTLLVIAGVGMYGWIVSPHVKYLQAVQRYRPAIRKIIDKQQDIKEMLVSRRTLLEKLKKQFNEVGDTIHTAEQCHQLFGELGGMAEQYGCNLAKTDRSADDPKIIIGEASDPTYVECVTAALTVLGDYGPLVGFVDCLQRQDRKIWISSIGIELLKDEMLPEQDSVLKCDIVLEIYVIQKKEVAVNDSINVL
jgi:hypothetical protein